MILNYITDTITNNAPIALWGLISLSISFMVRNIVFNNNSVEKSDTQEFCIQNVKDVSSDLRIIPQDTVIETLQNLSSHFDFIYYKLLLSTEKDIKEFRQKLQSDYDNLAFDSILAEPEHNLLDEYYVLLYKLATLIDEFNTLQYTNF